MNANLKARIQSECFFANQMNERPCLKQTPSWPQFFLFLLLEQFPPLFSTLPHRLICSTRLRCFILFIVDSMHNRRFKSSIYQLPEFLLLFQSLSSKIRQHSTSSTTFPAFWPWISNTKHSSHLWNYISTSTSRLQPWIPISKEIDLMKC